MSMKIPKDFPDDILHNILSYVDLYEDKRIQIFNEIKEINDKRFSDLYYEIVMCFFFDYLRREEDYTIDEALEDERISISSVITYTDYNDFKEQVKDEIYNLGFIIEEYLNNPNMNWMNEDGNIIYNIYADFVNEYYDYDNSKTIYKINELKSNYLYENVPNDFKCQLWCMLRYTYYSVLKITYEKGHFENDYDNEKIEQKIINNL